MVMEQAAFLSQRLDNLVAEAERLETEIRTNGDHATARDLQLFSLELRLARRSLAALLPAVVDIDTPAPFHPLRSMKSSPA